jgi:hypothetical protein
MRKIVSVILLVSILALFGVELLAQTASPAASAIPAAVAATPAPVTAALASTPTSHNFFELIYANKALLGLLAYALLDCVVLFVPSLKGNGIVHQLLLVTGAMSAPAAPGASNPPAAS